MSIARVFAPDQITVPSLADPVSEGAAASDAAKLKALFLVWANSLEAGKANGFTTLIVTMPTEQADTLCRAIGDAPDDLPVAWFDQDAADLATRKNLAAWVSRPIALQMPNSGSE
jgi:hypothetical protein